MIHLLKSLQRLGAVLVLIGAVFLVYWPALRNGFVWDDTALIGRDPLIRSWRLIPEAFGHFLFLDATPSNFYRPLQRLSFMGDYAAWEMMPLGFHLTSLYIHLAAAVALYFLALQAMASFGRSQTTPNRHAGALLIALLWAIHPLHTSAVTYVAGRADPLAALFGFGALTLGLISLKDPRRPLAGIGAALGFLAALLSKESGIFALIVWLLMLAWMKIPRATFLRWSAIGAAILVSYGALRWSAEKIEPPATKSTASVARPILITQAAARYTGLFLAPLNLHMERDLLERKTGDGTARKEPGPLWLTVLGATLIAALALWIWWAKRQAPLAGIALLAMTAAYLPISNLFPLNATLAEHWLYVPSAFLLLALVATLTRLGHGRIWGLLLGGWGIFLGYQTYAQQGYWLDQRTFLTRTIQAGGDTARMRVNLGNLEAGEGNLDEAAKQYELSLERTADLPFATLGMAGVEIRRGHYQTAREFLERANREPFLAGECLQMRAALEYRETKRDSTPLLKAAVELAPHSWALRKRFLLALEQTGRREIAVRELEAFLQEEAFRADSWRLLGNLQLKQKKPELALPAFLRACELDVHDDESALEIKTLHPQSAPKP